MTAKYPEQRTENLSSADRSWREKQEGHGKRPNATKALTVQDEEQLWKNRVLGEQNPKSLLYTLWYLLTLHFGFRGCQEHHEMFVEDFSLNKDDQGTEYVTFEENPTKTRQGGLEKETKNHPAKDVGHWWSSLSSPVLQSMSCPQT